MILNVRAAGVINELRRTGYGWQIPVDGLADTRFNHLDEQIPEYTRFVLARQVGVVVHAYSGDI